MGEMNGVSTDRKWDESNYVKAYQLASEGMSADEIRRTFKVSTMTWRYWLKTKPALAEAIRSARNKGKSGVETFHEYVYEKLPDNLKAIWDEIERCETDKTAVGRVEALLAGAGKRARQHLFLHALVSRNFNASKACKAVNISKSTFDGWVLHDPEFAELIDQIHWHKGNFFEGQLIKLVEMGDTAAVLAVNRTYNADRGYGNKVKVEHSGEVHHEIGVSIDDLPLSLEDKKKILKAIRDNKSAELPEHVEDAEYTIKQKEKPNAKV